VILMDLLMPIMDGIEATVAIRRELPDGEIIVLTSVLEDASVIGAVRAEAIGYLPKDAEADELCLAIRAAAAGQVQLSAKAAERLMREVRAPKGPEILTERETEVVRLLARVRQTKRTPARWLSAKNGQDSRQQHPGRARRAQPHAGSSVRGPHRVGQPQVRPHYASRSLVSAFWWISSPPNVARTIRPRSVATCPVPTYTCIRLIRTS
jgi:ActR/RegA family two-component response regulator